MNAVTDMDKPDNAAAHLAAARAKTADADFFDAFYGRAAGDDLQSLSPDQLVTLADTAQAALLAHQAGGIDVTLTESAGLSLLLCVNDDRPFLFDSALAAAVAAGAKPRAVFHPIIRGVSLIAMVLDQTGDAGTLLESLRGAFTQGRMAVADWQPMMARLDQARAELAHATGQMELLYAR